MLDNIDWLREEYLTKGRTLQDIRAETGASKSAVYRALARFGLSKVKQRRAVSRDWLEQRYVHDLASVHDIAAEADCSVDTIKSWASIYKLERGQAHKQTEQGRSAYSRSPTDETRRKMSEAKIKPDEGYIRGRLMMGQDRRYLHRIIAQEVLGRELSPDEHVHHMDCDKTNHHPINLLVLPRMAHSALHICMRQRPGLDQIEWLKTNLFNVEYLGDADYHCSPAFRKWHEARRSREAVG